MARILITLISAFAVIAGLAALAAGPGARFGVWDYMTGFTILRAVGSPLPMLQPYGSPAAILAVLSALSFVIALFVAPGRAVLALIGAFAAAAAAYAPMQIRARVEANPRIHDITTDIQDPPAIVAAADAPRRNPAHYVGAEPAPGVDEFSIADAQVAAFPDIKPLVFKASVQDATAAARDAVVAMGMEIIAEGPAGDAVGSGWRIEAVATSFWFGFKDDFIVRLTPLGEGVRVDVRSKSRVGLSDLGANAARIRTFSSQLTERLGPAV